MVPARMDLKKLPLSLYLWNSTSFCPVAQAFIQIERSRLLTMYSDKWICGLVEPSVLRSEGCAVGEGEPRGVVSVG